MHSEMFIGRQQETKEIYNAWSNLCATNNGPKFLILSGERGIGKTSIVLEFYRQLVASNTNNSYWPCQIHGVNPSFESHDIDVDTSIPFLWWGMKFVKGGRAIETFLPDVEPHLKTLYLSRVRRSIGLNVSMMAAEAALNIAGNYFTGGALFVCNSLASARNLYEAHQLSKGNKEQEEYENDGVDTAQARNSTNTDKKILADFRCLFDEPNKKLVQDLIERIKTFSRKDMDSIPMILFLDQLESIDKRSLDFLEKFFCEASDKSWPVFIIGTCHSFEIGGEHRLIDKLLSPLNDEAVSHMKIKGIASYDTCKIWQAKLPGLTTQQITELSFKVDGNPQMMWELISWLKNESKWFENRDTNAPLTEIGMKKVRLREFTLHNLVADRIRKQGESVADVVGLSSYQGIQFVDEFVKELSRCLRLVESNEDAEAIMEKAQNPLNITHHLGSSLSEFSHSTYFEVAQSFLSDLKDVNPHFKELVANTLVEKMTKSDYPAASHRTTEILSRITLEVIPTTENPVSNEDIYRKFARIRALALMTKIVQSPKYSKMYLTELPQFLTSIVNNQNIISTSTFPLEHTLRPLFENFANRVDCRDEALACLKQIIFCYLGEGQRVKDIGKVRLIQAVRFFSSAIYGAQRSFRANHVRNFNFSEETLSSLSKKYEKEIDNILLGVEQSKNMPAYLKQSSLALLAYGKSLLGLDQEKTYRHKLIQACQTCVNENAPEEITFEVMDFAISKNSPNDTPDFFEYICNYLESLREAHLLTPRQRSCYHAAIKKLHNITADTPNKSFEYAKKDIQLYVQAIKMEEGHKQIKDKQSFLNAVQSGTRSHLLISKNPDETLSDIVKLLEDLPSYLYQHKNFIDLFDISKTIMTTIVLNMLEDLTDPELYMRKMFPKVLDTLGLTSLSEDPDINTQEFLEKTFLNILTKRLNSIALNETDKKEQIKWLKLLADKAPQMKVDGKIKNFEEWCEIEKVFKQYSTYNWRQGVRIEVGNYIDSRILKVKATPEQVVHIDLLYSLKYALKM